MRYVLLVVAGLVWAAVLVGFGWWLRRRLVVAPGWSRAARRVADAALVAALGLFVASAALLRRVDPEPVRPLLAAGLTLPAVLLYLAPALAVLAVVGWTLGRRGRAAPRRRVLRVGTPLVVVGTLALTTVGAVVAARPDVTRQVVVDPDLPVGFDGLRVALLTDLHVGPIRDAAWARRAVELIAAQEPDLVLLGGDLVDGSPADVGDYLAPLADLDAPLGVFAVTGNHEMLGGESEASAWVGELEELGIDVLANERVTLRRGGDAVVLSGVHDATGTGELATDADAALDGVPPETFTLHLAHQPHQVDDLPSDADVDLQLSGHTHGGQLWPTGWLSALSDPVVAGLGRADGIPLYVSRGYGTSGPPIRLGSPPTIDLLTLRR